MKDIRQLHREAMVLAKDASAALNEGDNTQFLILASSAFNLEREAALEIISDFDAEPTRSVLFRSAATMAFNIGNYVECQKLTHLALAGNPYDEIRSELVQLLEQVDVAIKANSPKTVGFENAYIENLRENAISIKLETPEGRYSRAVVIDYITDFLKNIQSCFSKFSEVNFKKAFGENDFADYSKTFNLFKKDTKVLCVDLRFKSFGLSIAVDSTLQNYREISSPKFKEFKRSLFSEFKEDVLLADLNSKEYQKEVQKKYTDEERNLIFSPLLESLKEKSKYRISIVDKEFKNVIKRCPVPNDKTIAILKPEIHNKSLFDDAEILLKRTFELTNSAGQRGEKILSENLEYAEFKVFFDNLTWGGKEAYFINTYEQAVIFNRGSFLIDDDYLKIYVESDDFNDVRNNYSKEVILKFISLIDKETEANNKNEQMNLDDRVLLDIYKSTLIKGT